MSDEPRRSRLSRWGGLVRLAIRRLWTQATGTSTGRTIAAVAVIGLTIALLMLVTGVALALADDGVATDDDSDVRITPDGGSTLSSVDGVESSRLGDTTQRSETIRSEPGVDHATPVLVETILIQSPEDDEPERVLAVGVVPNESTTVAGLATDELASDDPAATEGGASGTVVLSAAAADRLDASRDDELLITSTGFGDDPAPVSVAAVDDSSEGDPETDTPLVLVSLEELQALSGADDGALADRILVWGDEDAAATAGEEAYPEATVEKNADADLSSLFDDGLALATSVIAFVVGIVVCSLFVATTAGLAVNEDRQSLAVLAAVGFPARSRLALVATTTMVTTVCGALVGIALGFGGIVVVNELAGATIASGAVAQAHPGFVPYAFVVALSAGLIAVPYPLAIAVRTNVLEEVGR